MKEIEFKIKGLMMDPLTNSPIVVLQDVSSDTLLPIWVGIFEANAIALQIEKVDTPRPMTHDLIRNFFEQLEVKVERIEVCDLRNNTYYAVIYLRSKDKLSQVDARPSDAIAIALRTDAPIFVKEEVITKFQKSEDGPRPSFDKENREKWAEILEKLDPSEFSKYKM